MKLPKHTVTAILLLFTMETQCGVIDNIFGRVKNTTNALKQDVNNVLSYSKSIVGIETPVDDRPEEERRGLIGGVFHSTRVKVHNIRNYFWNTDANTNDSGLFGNMYNRVKNTLSKAKGSLLGDNQIRPQPPSENEKLVQKTLDKLFFGNGTRQVHGRAFQEAIQNLRSKLQEIRNNVKNGMKTPLHHGEGLIDVRAAAINSKDFIEDNTAGVDNDIYDPVQENLNKVRDETAKSYNNIKNDADKSVASLANAVNNAAAQLNEVTAKENELLKNSFNNFSAGAQQLGNSIKNIVDDASRLS